MTHADRRKLKLLATSIVFGTLVSATPTASAQDSRGYSNADGTYRTIDCRTIHNKGIYFGSGDDNRLIVTFTHVNEKTVGNIDDVTF